MGFHLERRGDFVVSNEPANGFAPANRLSKPEELLTVPKVRHPPTQVSHTRGCVRSERGGGLTLAVAGASAKHSEGAHLGGRRQARLRSGVPKRRRAQGHAATPRTEAVRAAVHPVAARGRSGNRQPVHARFALLPPQRAREHRVLLGRSAYANARVNVAGADYARPVGFPCPWARVRRWEQR